MVGKILEIGFTGDFGYMRFHDLRHTFATMAISIGVDVKTLSSKLGHFSAGFTLNTYTHITNDMQRGATKKPATSFMEAAKATTIPDPSNSPEESIQGYTVEKVDKKDAQEAKSSPLGIYFVSCANSVSQKRCSSSWSNRIPYTIFCWSSVATPRAKLFLRSSDSTSHLCETKYGWYSLE